MSIPLIPNGNTDEIELQIIIAMLGTDPYVSDENGKRCHYCGSDYNLNLDQHFMGCAYAIAQNYVDNLLKSIKEND